MEGGARVASGQLSVPDDELAATDADVVATAAPGAAAPIETRSLQSGEGNKLHVAFFDTRPHLRVAQRLNLLQTLVRVHRVEVNRGSGVAPELSDPIR